MLILESAAFRSRRDDVSRVARERHETVATFNTQDASWSTLENYPMSFKNLIVSSAAAMTVALSAAAFAETASDKAAAGAEAQERANVAADTASGQPAGTAEQYKHQKVDEATAADAKFHANRTEANMKARDKAESDAAAAAGMPHPMDQTNPR